MKNVNSKSLFIKALFSKMCQIPIGFNGTNEKDGACMGIAPP